MEKKKMEKKKNAEWDTMCPVCGGRCEYGEQLFANESEVWFCANQECGATIDVSVTIIRHSGVTVSCRNPVMVLSPKKKKK